MHITAMPDASSREPSLHCGPRQAGLDTLCWRCLKACQADPTQQSLVIAQTCCCNALAMHALQTFTCFADCFPCLCQLSSHASSLIPLFLPIESSCPQPVEAGCHKGLLSTWHPGGSCRLITCQAWPLCASPSLAAGVWHLQVVKKIWEYIKEHNLQNPKNKRKIIVDDTLGATPREGCSEAAQWCLCCTAHAV